MLDELNWLMENQFANNGWGYRSYATVMKVDEETGEEYEDCGVAAEVAIADLFRANGYADDDFSVVQNTWSTSPATDEGFVSVAWCEDGKLHHEVYELYN